MALTYGFYNSIEGDRVYDAIQFGRIFDGIIKDGVYATYEKGMMVIASSNPAEVIIQPGRAWFNHTWSYNDANVIFDAPAPEVLLERIDALVLEINTELSSRENSFKWVQGIPSSRPEKPTLTNTSTIHQYPLCYVHRYPETTMIYTRDITNAIGTSECPFATGVLEGIDLDAWINQWDDEFHDWETTTKTGFETWMLNQEQVYTTWFNSMSSQMDTDLAAFEAWFETIQGIIDEEAALHLQQEIDELRQEATSGSRIFVSTLNQSLYGRDVTITEAGGTVFTSRFDNTGVAEFKSVPYVGNLTISSTDGVQTATSVVNTPYFARYNFQIAFWAATVNIVGDPEMSGYTVTVRDSGDILVGTVVLDSEGAGIFTATAPDTYKFILTYGGETMEVTLSVTQETTYTVELHADRFKWENWVDASMTLHSTDYESLEEVLADEEAIRQLMLVHACVDYMAGIDKDVEDVQTIIENDLAAKWINLSDYALDTLYANEIIAGYMDTADKYFYGEWVITDDSTTPPTWGAKGNVPVMTSDTAPYGEAFASSVYSSGGTTYSAYRVFDGNDTTQWHSTSQTSPSTGQFVGYRFANPINPKEVIFGSQGDHNGSKVKIQGSNDGTNYVDLTDDYTIVAPTSAGYFQRVPITKNKGYYLYLRLYVVSSTYSSGKYFYTTSLQFYGRELSVSVPTMTSDTTPYGEASADNYQSGYNPYKAFDKVLTNNTDVWHSNDGYGNHWCGYIFTSKKYIKKMLLRNRYSVSSGQASGIITNFKIQYTYDGTTWNDVTGETITNTNQNLNGVSVYEVNKEAKGFRIQQVGGDYAVIQELNFYGLDYSEKEFEEGTNKKWLYDHGVKLVDTYDGIGSTAGCSVEYRDDEIVSRNTSGNSTFTQFAFIYFPAENPINLSNYTLAKSKFGDMLLNPSGTGAYANQVNQVAVRSAKQSGTYSDDNLIAGYNATIPVTNTEGCLDISSVSGNAYICLGAGYWANQIVTYKEVWLE